MPRIPSIASILVLAALCLGASAAQGDGGKEHHLYAVFFGIVADENDQIVSIRIAKVIDPTTGSTDPVAIKPAEAFIVAAEKAIKARGYKARIEEGRPIEFFTYFFYDPTQPNRIDIDPKGTKGLQPEGAA